jgi:hypothetical protein
MRLRDHGWSCGPRSSWVGIFMIAATALALFATPSPAAISVASYATGRDSAERCDPRRSGFKGTATQFVAMEKSNPTKFRGCYFEVSFDEIISAVSMKVLYSVLAATRDTSVSLNLNSDGGDVGAALHFAARIRGDKLDNVWFIISDHDHCYSSCVLLLASGFMRTVYGEVGIHRPYFTEQGANDMGYDSLKQAYDATLVKVKEFFNSVNINEKLATDMWFVPSSKVKILTAAELEEYGLSSTDAVLKEQENADLRRTCGDGAPTAQEDFFARALPQCVDQATHVLDTKCINENWGNHPFCRCFAEANPTEGIMCK